MVKCYSMISETIARVADEDGDYWNLGDQLGVNPFQGQAFNLGANQHGLFAAQNDSETDEEIGEEEEEEVDEEADDEMDEASEESTGDSDYESGSDPELPF